MTTRLKRKLADLGVDASSRKANESFCLIGTPLPPLEKSKDTGEFVPLWKQEVKDDKGRRRLHGAFTGGFSAGYFNTVGSKEGWAPSNFVSSRSDRAKAKQARPEDFMDDEDMAELAESRQLVDTTEELDLTAGTRPSGDDESESMARKLESALLPPPSDSPGAQILKKMGWRLGQGIGPRLTFRQKRLQDITLGTAGDADMDVDEDGEDGKHTYAPRDTPLLLPSRKTDTQGLGYDPGTSLHRNTGKAGNGMNQGPNLSAGFGLGALNEAEDDDIDVYDSGVNRGRTQMAYDAMDQDDREDIIMGGPSRERGSRPGPSSLAQTSEALAFSDGRPVLKGFVIAAQPAVEDKWYPLPEVPKGWKPDPRRVWGKGQDKENETVSEASALQPAVRAHHEWKKGISADQRGSTLGETPLPAAPRSVFDYMSQKDRERLQRAASSVSGSVNPEAAAPSSSISWPPPSLPAAIHIPRLEPFIAKAALQGFQPFLNDPVKHERYTIYLNSQSHADGSYAPLQPYPGQKIDAFNKEVSDFAKAGAVFKPLSAAMAGRFTSAAAVENGPVAQEGLYQPTFKEEDEAAAKEEEKKAEEKVEDNPQTNAARAGMYGPMTRTVTKWTPAKLLCKRFGVKDPNPEPDPEDEVQSNSASTSAPPVAVAAITLPEAHSGESTAYADASETKRPSGPRDLASVGLGEDEYQAQDVLTYERPSMDVFKAIFASDDEDSDDEVASAADTKLVPVGPHLAAVDPAASTKASAHNPPQEEKQSANVGRVAPESGPVDLSSFKPTFVPRGDREARKDDAGRASDRKKKDKKAIVLFDAEDVDDSGLGAPKAKKRKEKQKGKDREKKAHQLAAPTDEDDMWVEKPPPEAVKKMLAPTSGVPLQPERMKPKGRQTAADLM